MAGYYEEEEHRGPHRPAAAQFDTMNMGAGPHRVAQFDTANMGAGPHRVAQFDTMNLGEPVRGQEPVNYRKPAAGGGDGAGFYTEATPGSGGGGGHTPMNPPVSKAAAGGNRMHGGLVITSLALRVAALVSLIIGLAVLASDSQTTIYLSASFSSFPSTKYALAAAIIGAVYSIYETVSAAVRLAMGHPLLPGNFSVFISYIGDQIIIVLLLTGASAAAATLKDLHDLQNADGISYCDLLGNFCKQGAGAIAMIFLGFCFLAASLVISSYCFYKRKS